MSISYISLETWCREREKKKKKKRVNGKQTVLEKWERDVWDRLLKNVGDIPRYKVKG